MNISYSSMTDFKNCRKLFYWRHIKRLEPKKIFFPFIVGEFVHKGIQDFYSKTPGVIEKLKKAIDKKKKGLKVFLTPDEEFEFEKQRKIIIGMVNGYMKTHTKEFKRWKVKGIESYFNMPINTGFEPKLKNPKQIEREFRFSGKIDMVVKTKEGYFVVEFKTVSSLNADYVSRLDMDSQISGYIIGGRRILRKPIVGVIYDVIQKPAIRQKKKETESQYMRRLEDLYKEQRESYYFQTRLYRDKKSLEKFEKELYQVTLDIRRAIRKDMFYTNPYFCDMRGRCQFFPLCTRGLNKQTERLFINRDDKIEPKKKKRKRIGEK